MFNSDGGLLLDHQDDPFLEEKIIEKIIIKSTNFLVYILGLWCRACKDELLFI